MSKQSKHNIVSQQVSGLHADFSWENVYFLGIGGIGMSALARYFKACNKHVAGYDKTKTKLTETIEYLGILVHYQDSIAHVLPRFLNPETTLVVYTPAIPKDHKELAFFNNNRFTVLKRSEALGLVTKLSYCMAVAGTHGKTTTTSILAHILYDNAVPLTAFLGGISENYNSNLLLSGTKTSVVEADEFDRSFLTLSPSMACVTSMDADHLDIYGDTAALQKAFIAFTERLKPNGTLFVKNGLPLKGITYGIEDDADYCIQNITIDKGVYKFTIKTPDKLIENVEFNLPGTHNLLNALAAFAMASTYGISTEALVKSLKSYRGVKRRFSYQIKTKDLVFIDDYAHHPTEINAVYEAVRTMYPDKKALAVFQPHLFSRTQDFMDAFAKSLSQFDAVLLLDIYPAREKPIPGVTSKVLLSKINNENKALVLKKNIVSEIKKQQISVVVSMGAGDIGVEVETIKKGLLE